MTSVAELTSLPLDQETTYVNKISYNRGAETLICRLAVAAGSPKCEPGMARAGQIWAAAGPGHQGRIVDRRLGADRQLHHRGQPGAAADDHGEATGRRCLAGDPADPRGRRIADHRPGEQPAKGKVVGKTGTLLAVDAFNPGPRYRLPTKALGGYIDTASGRHFAFAVMATNSVFADIEGVFAANDDVGAVVASIQESY